jgi:LytR cell envelope-related transcriptional attenuator
MGRVNIGTARIIIVLALVVGGVAVLANGFGGAATVAAPGGGGVPSTGSVSPSASSSPTKPPKETPSPQVQGVLIAVFNGTNETGLAGQVQQTLEADGYVAAQDPADAPSKPVAKTIVYFRGGANAAQNRSDANHIADTYFGGARVALLGSDQTSAVTIDKSAQVVIIVGVDYADLVANQ